MKPQSSNEGVYGLVLAGGESSRIGKDKSLIRYHGLPQKDFAFQILCTFCVEVFTSVGKDSDPAMFKNPIVDKHQIGGPMNGILSAMDHMPDVSWLTLPVDMPGVDESTLELLITQRNTSKLATCFVSKSGNIEPLLAIWEPQARSSLITYKQKGGSSLNKFLTSNPVQLIELKNEDVLININYLEDLDSWKAMRSKS